MSCDGCSWRAIPHRFTPDRWIVHRHIGGNISLVLENDAGNEKLFRSQAAAQRAADKENQRIAASAAEPAASTAAVRDVLAERRRQVEVEGWTPEHDDEHSDGELADAAACYAMFRGPQGDELPEGYWDLWPWDREWWKPKDRRRNLVRAAALMLAAIERIDRAATPAAKKDTAA